MTMTSADDRHGSQNATSHTQCHSLTQLVMLFVLVFINKAVHHYEHDRGQTFARTASKSAQCVRPSSPWNYPIIIHRRMCSQHVWIMRYIKTLCGFWSDCKYTQHRCVCSVWPVKTNALFLASVCVLWLCCCWPRSSTIRETCVSFKILSVTFIIISSHCLQ